MRLFHHRGSPEPEEPPGPPPVVATTEAQVLALLSGTSHSRPSRSEPVNLLDRVFELTNDDWTEQEAGEELAWLAGNDRHRLTALHQRLVAGLVRDPFPDVRGIRASRIAAAALRQCPVARCSDRRP
jgi:hypothetical protein